MARFTGVTHQMNFSQAEFADKKKVTRREKFPARMEEIIPRASLTVVPPANRVRFPGRQELKNAKLPLISVSLDKTIFHNQATHLESVIENEFF